MKRALYALSMAGFVACGSDPTPPPPDPIKPTLGSIQSHVFAVGCAVSKCHDAATHEGNLVLTDAATSYANLVGVPAYEIAPKVPDGGALDGGTYPQNI